RVERLGICDRHHDDVALRRDPAALRSGAEDSGLRRRVDVVHELFSWRGVPRDHADVSSWPFDDCASDWTGGTDCRGAGGGVPLQGDVTLFYPPANSLRSTAIPIAR